jgi:hypothetical protein
MSRRTVAVTLVALVISSSAALVAQRASRGSVSRSGGSSTWQGQHASGSRTVSQTGSGAASTRQAQTQAGGSRTTTGTWTPRTGKSTRRLPPRRPGASRRRGPARSRGKAVMQRSRGAGARAPGVLTTRKAWRAATTPVSRRSPARSTPSTTAPTTRRRHAIVVEHGGCRPVWRPCTTTLPSGRTTTHTAAYYTYGATPRHLVDHDYYPVPPHYLCTTSRRRHDLMLAGGSAVVGSCSTDIPATARQRIRPCPAGAMIATPPTTRVRDRRGRPITQRQRVPSARRTGGNRSW